MRTNFFHFQIRESVFDGNENQDSLFLLPNAQSSKIRSTDEAREKENRTPKSMRTRTHTHTHRIIRVLRTR